jgi:hypothetical protein
MNVHSLERALALRRMVIAKMQAQPDEAGYAERFKIFEAKGLEVEQEAAAARKLIIAIIEMSLQTSCKPPLMPNP